MSHTEMTWQSFDGLPVYAQAWLPDTGTKAVVALVHGLGEHSGRYGHVAAALNRAGYAVVTRDLRGHGQSGGQKGHAPSFEALLKDIDQLVAQARELVPGKPLFLYGHSLGGIFVLDYALSRHPPIAGVVSTSPGLRTALHEQKAKLAVAKVMGKVAPTGDLASGLDPQSISRDPAVIQAYVNDPLVHDRVTFGAANVFQEAIAYVYEHGSEFPVPLLLMHGTNDVLAFPQGSKDVAALVKRDCTLQLWEGLSHETHNEPEKEQVLGFVVGWLDEHLPH
ncbi:MAG TPA: lysophospholipase [Anaerolineae bacterium]|nr:lysophospholipase [Anaerolineae bacterium]HNT04916.1 lysophospholipase [Anaerolineae bacterium]